LGLHAQNCNAMKCDSMIATAARVLCELDAVCAICVVFRASNNSARQKQQVCTPKFRLCELQYPVYCACIDIDADCTHTATYTTIALHRMLCECELIQCA
jgi:hypothetical protein